jgi:predicted SPOUT superfamily RNA methylase MTH1
MGKKSKTAPPTDGATDDQPSTSGRRYTVSMAVPGSIIDNTQNFEFATFVAGQVARTAAVFNVDEVVVFDDTPDQDPSTVSAGTAFLARVIQYLETPQYLRKTLIPMHPDLRLAGLLPPLDASHHLRTTEWLIYREGAVLRSEPGKGSYVDIGLDRMAHIKEVLPANTRVTLHVGESPTTEFMPDFGETMIIGKVGVMCRSQC